MTKEGTEGEEEANPTNNEIENLLNESTSVIQKIKKDFPLVLNNESGADLVSMKHRRNEFGNSKSAGRIVNNPSIQRFSHKKERPFTMSKAEKIRCHEIEVANEALLKRMMKIVNVSKIHSFFLFFIFIFREKTSLLANRTAAIK